MAGTMDIVIKNEKEIKRDIKAMQKKSTKAVNRTIGDFKSRAPSWVAQEVTAVYNVKKKDVNETKKGAQKNGSIKVKGVSLDNVSLIYQGRLLTPIHFGMTPKARPASGSYKVMAKFKKNGSKKVLGHDVFLGAPKGVTLPFQRLGDERLPIRVITTLSVPQMITNPTVSDNIQKRINTEMKKRLKHNLKQAMKK